MATEEKEYTYDERQETPYAMITEKGEDRRLYQPKNVWELKLSDFVSLIDPTTFFVTSGEGVLKSRKLEKDLFKMAGKARKLVNVLNKLKGENIYLETTWHEGRLLIKAKNPRKFPEEKAKALEENFCYGTRESESTSKPEPDEPDA